MFGSRKRKASGFFGGVELPIAVRSLHERWNDYPLDTTGKRLELKIIISYCKNNLIKLLMIRSLP